MNKVGLGVSPSQSWHRDLARLIDHIRMRNFPEVLNDCLQSVVTFDPVLMATYKHAFKPIVVFSTLPQHLEPTLNRYVNQIYLLDPLFNAIQAGLAGGVYRLREISPSRFESSEYYRSCYHEFGLLDEIILVIPLENDVSFTLSLGRKSSLGTITRAERNTLNQVFPVISALVHQFWLAQSSEYVHNEDSRNAMEYALATFGSGVLTNREQEITGLILKGHSSKAIADLLDISAGTVKVHRKNIHARLNTGTQSELFSMFLGHLSSLAGS